MNEIEKKIPGRAAMAVFAGFLIAAGILAQDGGEDIRQVVARVSYLNGNVSYARGDDPDNWQAADINVPLTLGDRLFTADAARAELQIQGGAAVRLSGNSDLAAMNLSEDTKQLSLTLGTAAFHIKRLGSDEVFEVDTPNAAITFDATGDYRIDVDNDGNTRVGVRRGRAIVAAGGGQVTVNAGDEMDINGVDAPQYDVMALAAPDGFDRWIQGREDRASRSRSRQYVSEDVVGAADLDDYGQWQDIPEYGRAWAPASVESGWAPYRAGHWVWQDPWGWTWVSAEPWGWAPYHSGRWITSASRWYWVPAARNTRVTYAPALVAFVGGDPGSSGGGFVGWFPLAPRDPFLPWWGRRGNAPAANVAYVNRSYATVVNQTTFVSGGIVTRSFVTDRAVVQQLAMAPVLRGPLPFVPTPESLRVAVRVGLPAPPRPPAFIVQRAVVARIAPPPAPPRFDMKLAVIRENHGAPVAPSAAARIVERREGGPGSVTAIRPVISQPGRMTLAPSQAPGRDAGRRPAAAAPAAAVPIAPIRGREIATAQKVIAPTGPAGQPGSSPPPAPNRSREADRPASPTSGSTAAPPAQQERPVQPVQPPSDDRRNPDRRRPPATPVSGSPISAASPAPVNPNPNPNDRDRFRRNPPAEVTTAPASPSQPNDPNRRNPERERVNVNPTAPPNPNRNVPRERPVVPQGQGQSPAPQPTRQREDVRSPNGPPDRSVAREAPARVEPPARVQPAEEKPRPPVKEQVRGANEPAKPRPANDKPANEKKDEKKEKDEKKNDYHGRG